MSERVGNGGSVINFVTEVHEERIQRIEEQLPELAVQVTQCVTDLGYVKKSLDGIDQKMDAIHGALGVHSKTADERMNSMTDRIKELEATDAKCVSRMESLMGLVKKLLLPTIAAGTGAFAAKYGVAAFDFFRG